MSYLMVWAIVDYSVSVFRVMDAFNNIFGQFTATLSKRLCPVVNVPHIKCRIDFIVKRADEWLRPNKHDF